MVSLVRDVSLDSSPYAISNDLYIISTEYYPSEPERAAEARRAVVASAFLFSFNSGTYHIFIGINF